MSDTFFCVNEKQVAHETFDGETLAVNVETGTYYSLAGVGARIWDSLLGGTTAESVIETLSKIYAADRSEITSAVAAFIALLQSENLIRAGEPASGTVAVAPAHGGQEKLPFSPPTMEVFSDMQDLLLLDPIHEVDEAGWPVLRSGADK